MDISPILSFLNDRYYNRGYTGTNSAIDCLSSLIAEHGKSAVTATIREQHGNCPHIVPMFEQEGRYFFKRFLNKIVYKGDIGYVYNLDHVLSNRLYIPKKDIYYLFDTADTYLVADAWLHEWVVLGEECEDCGTPFLNYDDNPVCDTCRIPFRLHEYSTKAEELLNTEDTKDLLMGVELEYEKVTAAQVGKYLRKHAIAKRDGTIHDGAEVVTRPACLATHKKALQPFYESVKTQAASNTGMHVHVEKKKLTNYQIGFMLQFLNSSLLVNPLTIVAGRDYQNNNYTRPKKDVTMTTGIAWTEDGEMFRDPTEKYSPLNTRKPYTVEVRIFSSPKTYEECCAKLDFVKGLVDYASPYSVSTKSLKEKFEWKTFLSFMQQNKKEFSHFYSYFIKENKFEGIA